ncbi:MAG: hypothetical protein WA124_06995 [Smithella sp.]
MKFGVSKVKKMLIGLVAGSFMLASASMALANGREAKNVILMISDGQGFNTVRATDYYTGKKAVSDFLIPYGKTAPFKENKLAHFSGLL